MHYYGKARQPDQHWTLAEDSSALRDQSCLHDSVVEVVSAEKVLSEIVEPPQIWGDDSKLEQRFEAVEMTLSLKASGKGLPTEKRQELSS